MKKLIILLILLVPLKSFAWKPDKWTMQDIILEGSFLTLLFIDCKQTHWISHSNKFKESNFILGENPSDIKINSYFLLFEGLVHLYLIVLLSQLL